jgi:hypothetical protein
VIRELADLEHYLDLAIKATFHGLPGETKCENLVALSRILNKAAVLDANVITAFEATGEQRAQGQASSIGWLQHNSGDHRDDAARRRRLALRLRNHPLAEQAMQAGTLTARHVDVLDHARRAVGDEIYRDHEATLVDKARWKRFSDFELAVTYFIHRNRPRDVRDQEERQVRDRWAHASRTFEGCGAIDAWMPPLDFTIWQNEFQRLIDHLYAADVAEATERLGRRPLSGELARDGAQRRSDAMMLMAQRSAAHDGDVGPSRLVVTVHGDTDLVAQLFDVLFEALDTDDDTDFDLDEALDRVELSRDSLHELEDGTVISLNTLLLALLTGTIRGYLHDPDGMPLRFGRERRLFTKPQADALRARFRRCCHPFGCDRTGGRLQADHTPEWEDGGPTDVDEADVKCGPHNRWKHNTKHQPPPEGLIDHGQRRTPPRTGP